MISRSISQNQLIGSLSRAHRWMFYLPDEVRNRLDNSDTSAEHHASVTLKNIFKKLQSYIEIHVFAALIAVKATNE